MRALVFAVVGYSAALAVVMTLPLAFGYQSFTILSGSMEPTIATGDVVVVDKISPLEARVGDVVSFRSPDDPAKIITHRARRISVSGNTVRFVTRGDANTGSERWSMSTTGKIGRVELRVPKIGYVTNRIGSRFGRLGFVVVPAVLLALTELWRIWRPASKERGHGHRR